MKGNGLWWGVGKQVYTELFNLWLKKCQQFEHDNEYEVFPMREILDNAGYISEALWAEREGLS